MENPLNDKFLNDRYQSELARKDKLSDSLGLPVSVLIVLGGLVVTMARGFSYGHPKSTVAFLVVVGLTTISFLCSLWYVSHAYHDNYEYERLPSLNDLYKALNESCSDNLDGRKELVMSQTLVPPQAAPKPQAESKPTAPKPEFPANTVFRNDQPVPQREVVLSEPSLSEGPGVLSGFSFLPLGLLHIYDAFWVPSLGKCGAIIGAIWSIAACHP